MAGQHQVGRPLVARRRQPAQRHAEQQDQHDPEPEVRERLPERRQEDAAVVKDASGGGRRPGSRPAPRAAPSARTPPPPGGRVGQIRSATTSRRRRAELERLAKVAPHDARQKDAVLDVERLSRPSWRRTCSTCAADAPSGSIILAGSPGQHPQDAEDDQRDAKQRQQRVETRLRTYERMHASRPDGSRDCARSGARGATAVAPRRALDQRCRRCAGGPPSRPSRCSSST